MLGLVGYVRTDPTVRPKLQMDWTRNQRRLLHHVMDKRSPTGLGKRGKIIKERDMWEGFCPVSFLFTCPATCRPTTETWNRRNVMSLSSSFISFILAIVMYRSKTGPALSNVIHPQKEKETNILSFTSGWSKAHTFLSISIPRNCLCVCVCVIFNNERLFRPSVTFRG